MKFGKIAIITGLVIVGIIIFGSFAIHSGDDAKRVAATAELSIKAANEAKAIADARPAEEKIAEILKSVATLDANDYNTRREWYDQIIALAPQNKEYKATRDRYKKLHDAEVATAVAARAQWEREIKTERKKNGVNVGATQQDVLDSSWGRPRSTSATTFDNNITSEFWHYDGGMLHFRNGVLDSITIRKGQ